MKLKIISQVGEPPLVIDAAMVICENAAGTPVMVAGHYGPEGTIRASHAKDEDFNETLRKLGVDMVVFCDTVRLPPPPPGARLIRDPRSPQ